MTVIDLQGARQMTVVPASAYMTAPQPIDYQGFRDSAGLAVTLDVTAITVVAAVSVAVLGVDETSGKTWPIGTMVALAAVGTTTLRIHPNNPTAAVSAGVQTQQGQIPPRVRIQVTQGNANSTNYSVGMDLTA